jgi:hypothetical protein
MRAAIAKSGDAPSNLATARARVETMKAERMEIELDRAVGRLVDIDEIGATVQKKFLAVRQAMLVLPDRVASRGGLARELVAAIQLEVELILTDLADGDFDVPTPEDVARCMAVRERQGLVRDLN